MAWGYRFVYKENELEMLLTFPQSKIGYTYPEISLLAFGEDDEKISLFYDVTLNNFFNQKFSKYEEIKKSCEDNASLCEVCKEHHMIYDNIINMLSIVWDVAEKDLHEVFDADKNKTTLFD